MRRGRGAFIRTAIPVLILGLLGAATPRAAAQDQGGAGRGPRAADRPFRSGVDLVALNVTVLDRAGLVGGLGQGDFLVVEDGVRQQISFFASSRALLDLAILLDTSSSITDVLSTAQSAAVGFARTLREGDRVAVIEIHDRADVLHPLSADVEAAVAAIRRTDARGGTALYNALYLALTDMTRKRMDTHAARRQAIAVLSDGQDTASLVDYEDVLQMARDAGIAIYAIALQPPAPPVSPFARPKAPAAPQYAMRTFAQVSGGRFFTAAGAGELTGIYQAIADELAHQYTLGYVSTNARQDGAFRQVAVHVIGRPQCAARTRAGYRAPRPRSAILRNGDTAP